MYDHKGNMMNAQGAALQGLAGSAGPATEKPATELQAKIYELGEAIGYIYRNVSAIHGRVIPAAPQNDCIAAGAVEELTYAGQIDALTRLATEAHDIVQELMGRI